MVKTRQTLTEDNIAAKIILIKDLKSTLWTNVVRYGSNLMPGIVYQEQVKLNNVLKTNHIIGAYVAIMGLTIMGLSERPQL